MDMIPMAKLHRLDLKPGDRLAVILPDGIVSARDVSEFRQMVQDQLDAWAPDLRAIVFPPGTKLSVLPAETEDPHPVGDAPTGGSPKSDDLGMPAAWVSGLR